MRKPEKNTRKKLAIIKRGTKRGDRIKKTQALKSQRRHKFDLIVADFKKKQQEEMQKQMELTEKLMASRR